MPHDASLWLFFLMVLGIIALPGMDMAFVLSNALVGGRRAGQSAVAGIVAGGICHVVAGTLGLAAVLQLVPGLMRVLLVAGALYIAWIGWSILRSQASLGRLPEVPRAPPGAVFRQAMATCLLNPKAYLFMVAVFPQFMRPGQGKLWQQALVLGAIIALTQIAVYGGLALLAAQSRRWLAGGADGGRGMVLAGRAVGLLLIGGAVYTAVQGWRSM